MQWSTDTDCSVATLLNFFDLVNTKEIIKVEAIWPAFLRVPRRMCRIIIECFVKRRLVLPYAAIVEVRYEQCEYFTTEMQFFL